ncbi:hypothetical protein BHE74_00043995 [Ensete ventricosum]|nr:hypothetical protein GW17_00042751 [Ensete ventricosum]RWW49788.1 hypothetical protein BHE74_00043995 [Ensete ventricosum]RZS09517.1 hypothetical protein BHM03_00040602 [Ensete ventricosum]
MGKYTRKCSRGVGELAVMEVTQAAGVRTRGRAHSLAAAAAAAVKSPRRRRTAAPPSTEVVQTSSYLQLRSRPLFRTIRRPLLQAENSAAAAAASDPGPAAEGISQCSSNGSSEVVGDGKRDDPLERGTWRSGRSGIDGSEGENEVGFEVDGWGDNDGSRNRGVFRGGGDGSGAALRREVYFHPASLSLSLSLFLVVLKPKASFLFRSVLPQVQLRRYRRRSVGRPLRLGSDQPLKRMAK